MFFPEPLFSRAVSREFYSKSRTSTGRGSHKDDGTDILSQDVGTAAGAACARAGGALWSGAGRQEWQSSVTIHGPARRPPGCWLQVPYAYRRACVLTLCSALPAADISFWCGAVLCLSSEAVGCAQPPCNSPDALAQIQTDRVAEDKLAGMVRVLKRRLASLSDMRQAWSFKVGNFKKDERQLLHDLQHTRTKIKRDKVDFEKFIVVPGPRGRRGPMGMSGPAGRNGYMGSAGQMGFYGEEGNRGPMGNMGRGGRSGVKGEEGPAGAQGPTGQKGSMGRVGVSGRAGLMGHRGMQGGHGNHGIRGERGSSIVGQLGEEGPRGDIGFAGEPGIPGQIGAAGLEGHQGLPGARGTKGAGGTPGIQGAPGRMGRAGRIGRDGNFGLIGGVGPPGSAGVSGSQGIQGNNGLHGIAGIAGSAGYSGFNGAPGAPGVTGNWGMCICIMHLCLAGVPWCVCARAFIEKVASKQNEQSRCPPTIKTLKHKHTCTNVHVHT